MAYDVVKNIRGREYRYRVERMKDPLTGTVRSRWEYVGKADGTPRAPASDSRQRLIAAFLQLSADQPWEVVRPAAIAREAGVATATFYRHFPNKDAILSACTVRANEALDRWLGALDGIAPSPGEERLRFGSWIVGLLRDAAVPPGLVRAWSELPASKLDGVRTARRALRIQAFTRYLTALRDRRYTAADGDIHPLAIALSLQFEALMRRHITDGELIAEDAYYPAVAECFDRLVFWRPPAVS